MITQERLKEVVFYQPHNGKFYWRKKLSNKVVVGSEAGILDKSNGYLKIGIDNKRYFLQKLAILYITGNYPKKDVHHKDEDKLNNSWNNLKPLSRSKHIKCNGIRKNNISGVTGVRWLKDRNKWVSRIRAESQHKTLGYFKNFEDAVRARYNAERKFGWFESTETTPAYLYLKNRGLINE